MTGPTLPPVLPSRTVVGIDGVGSQWIGAWVTETPASWEVTWLMGTMQTLLQHARDTGVDLVGVDVPLGCVETGRRSSDQEAWKVLGRRAGSLFPTPPLASLTWGRHHGCTRPQRAAASALSLQHGGSGISHQSWALVPKTFEVEDHLVLLGGTPLQETHPESLFALLGRAQGESFLPSKRTPEGERRREALLGQAWGRDLTSVLADIPQGCPKNDALDALGAALSMERHLQGTSRTLGGDQEAYWSTGEPAPGRGVIIL